MLLLHLRHLDAHLLAHVRGDGFAVDDRRVRARGSREGASAGARAAARRRGASAEIFHARAGAEAEADIAEAGEGARGARARVVMSIGAVSTDQKAHSADVWCGAGRHRRRPGTAKAGRAAKQRNSWFDGLNAMCLLYVVQSGNFAHGFKRTSDCGRVLQTPSLGRSSPAPRRPPPRRGRLGRQSHRVRAAARLPPLFRLDRSDGRRREARCRAAATSTSARARRRRRSA